MTRHFGMTALVALVFLVLAVLSGAYRRPALIGTTTASFTAAASILAMNKTARGGGKAVQRALAVMAVAFLVRILLVGLGTALVGRSGEDAIAYVVSFFVPYFIFAAIEGSFVHSLSRRSGTPA